MTLSSLDIASEDTCSATWTAREIAQQPAVWLEVARLIAAEQGRLRAFLDPSLARPGVRVLLSGAGTSAFIGTCLAPALSTHADLNAQAIATTDIVSGPELHLQPATPTLLVSFARSGNSPESVATVDLAERIVRDVHHLIITCNADGALAKRARTLRNAQTLVLPEATNDRGFAMTSSFTAMLLAAGLLFGAIRREKVETLSQAAERLLTLAWPIAQALVNRKFQRVVYLGSNELYGLACEAALKSLELTDGRIVAIAQSSLGFRHGPKTIINDETLAVFMLSNHDYVRAYDLDLFEELQRDARAGGLLLLTPRRDSSSQNEQVLVLPDMDDARDIEAALLHILPAQVFGLLQSLALGLTPDRPNAAGVVNRVVEGVNIHTWDTR